MNDAARNLEGVDTTPHDPRELREHPAIQAVYAGLSLGQAADKHHVSKPTLATWLRKVREHFGDDGLPAAFLRRSAAMKKPSTVALEARTRYPILAHVPAGYREGHAHYEPDPIGWYTADEPVRLIGDKLPPFAFTVVGDSMTNHEEPVQFKDGDIVLVDPNRAKALDNYDFVVACDYLGKMTLKQFVLRPDGVKVLHPLNRAYPDVEWDDETWWIAGVVVEGKRPERLLYSKNAGKRRR